jgi:glycosyltransferase involved in cell wall biosynthesis
MSSARRTRFIVDASPLAAPRTSGVGHSVQGIVAALAVDPDFTARYELHLVAPARGMKYVRAHRFPGVVYRPIPLPARVWNRLPGTPLMPPMDLLLGRGVYFLTNFRSWPLIWSPSMVLVHDVAFRLFPHTLTPRHRAFLERNVPRWMAQATLVITPSASARQDVVGHFHVPADRVKVIPHGIDTAAFHPRPSTEIAAARTKYGLPERYILFEGNLEPRKNVARLIRAYTALPQNLRDTYALVLIGGSSWLDEELEHELAQARAAGARVIRPTAYVTDADLPAVFSGARLFAWPTLHEGFGMPLLEAMATDVPVLTARNSSLPEVAGEAGLYVDATSDAAVTAGLRRLLTDEPLRTNLVSAGHERVGQFTWAAAAATLTKLATNLVSGRPVAGKVTV